MESLRGDSRALAECDDWNCHLRREEGGERWSTLLWAVGCGLWAGTAARQIWSGEVAQVGGRMTHGPH